MADAAKSDQREQAKEPNWSEDNYQVLGVFTAQSTGRKWKVWIQGTENGDFPPRSRVIVEPNTSHEKPSGDPALIVEDTERGLLISNRRLMRQLSRDYLDIMIESIAKSVRRGMINGWNAAAPYFYEQGVNAERDRAAEARAEQGAATRRIHDEVAAEARDTGRSARDILTDRLRESPQGRRLRGVQEGDEVEENSWAKRCERGDHSEECGHPQR